MMRIIVENAFFFLLPTIGYVGWVAFRRNDWPGLFAVLRDAPLLKLFASGAALMLTTLVLFSKVDGGRPNDIYQPSVFKDGHLEPGHVVPGTK